MDKKIIAIEDFINKKQSILKLTTTRLQFPLSDEDKDIITVMQKMLYGLKGVGLAAPQININKNIAVIYIPKTTALLREGGKTYPMHTLINAEYEPVNDQDQYSDFEACYSVKTVCGQVPRYRTVKVRYQNEQGMVINKIETGFYARVLQHEIDHLNGILITDVLTLDCLQGTFAEMASLHRESLSQDKKILFDKLLKQKSLDNKNSI